MDADEGFAAFDVERELARDGAWLRRAALALTNDPGTAEDAAQAVWIQAWRRRSTTGHGASRGWLMQVLRNSVRGHHRDGARRSAREREAAVPESYHLEDPAQRIELQRITLDAIEALDEPYRSTIVERFLNGRSIEEIARRAGAPRKTVETWSRRGILRLREALQGRRDSRGLAVLVLLEETARQPGPAIAAGASAGASLGPWGAASAASLLGLAALGAMSLMGTRSAPDGDRSLEVRPVGGHWRPELREIDQLPSSAARLGAAGKEEAFLQPGDGADSVAVAEVITLDGTPVPGAEIIFVGPSESAGPRSKPQSTDAAGRATFPSPPRGAADELLTVASRGTLSTVLRPRLHPGAVARVVVAHRMARELRVVDSDGAPIHGARVRAEVPTDRLERFGTGDGVESVPRWSVTTDAAGDAAIADFPRHDSVELSVEAPGFEPLSCPSEELPAVVSLRRESDRGIVGRIVDPFGEPVPNAWVGVGDCLVRTGADGRFSLQWAPRGRQLRAVAEGFQPVRSEIDEGREPFELRLERMTETLPLVVDGSPPGRLLAVLEGEEPFGLASMEVGASILHAEVSAEALGAGRHAGGIEPAVLGADLRRATLAGLQSRPYQLFVVSVERAEVIASLEVVPNSLELRVSSGKLGAVSSVVGRVVSAKGGPVPGAEVRIAPRSIGVSHGLLRRAVTDEEGVFQFEGVGGSGWTLFVSRESGGELEATIDVAAATTGKQIQIELSELRRARLQVEDPELMDARLSLLDEAKLAVPMISRVGRSTFRCESLTLGDGRTGVLEFSARAVWARLETKAGEELRKLPSGGLEGEGGVEVLLLE
ncbi:RNA polymerase sigma factor [Planctomycetes bacterium Poly30]|uniref:RNA polymerase sigma factor n=1 Tax=Saltatorellus ferox TaxID=2528018 RepID=A0A518EXQ9_9BACT|nr:RNA polymerase sigma factor [Planctomycetes bacterium Poly30]